MADDVFVIENGTTLRGYPRRAESPAAFKWPSEDAQRVESELFKSHAHFLLENRGAADFGAEESSPKPQGPVAERTRPIGEATVENCVALLVTAFDIIRV